MFPIPLRYQIVVITIFLFFSCNKMGKEQSENSEFEQNKESADSLINDSVLDEESIIPIKISLTHPDELQFGEPMRYSLSDANNTINIRPTSRNYDGFFSGKRYEFPIFSLYGDTEDVEYLNIDAIIQNHTSENISINSLNVEVEKSEIDPRPYLYLHSAKCLSNRFLIFDEGWSDYGNMIIEYSILRKGEKFDGKYRKTKVYKRPKDFIKMDLTSDLIEMGYNWENIKSKNYENGELEYVDGIFDSDGIDPNSYYYPFEWADDGEGCYEGFCRIYGRIKFSNHAHVAEFSGRISLSCRAEFGAALDYNDKFDIELKDVGESYTLKMPYITTIRPESVERIGLRIKCNKSTFHTFHITAPNDNGLTISTPTISLIYMLPRHSIESFPLD